MLICDNVIFCSAEFGWGGLPPHTFQRGVPLASSIGTGRERICLLNIRKVKIMVSETYIMVSETYIMVSETYIYG